MKQTKPTTPRHQNSDLATNTVRKCCFKYKDHADLHKWWEYCNALYLEMHTEQWCFDIKYWVCRERVKTVEAKRNCEHMHKALVVSGKSGVGKTTLWDWLIGTVLVTHNVTLGEYCYQSPVSIGDRVKV